METTTTGYAPVNGLNMYYEIHGSGRPLVLVHGALSGIGTSFGEALPLLAKSHRVVAVELQGHAHTADVDRPLTPTQMADDVAALVRHLGIEEADFFGYSLGASVVMRLAQRHSALARRLVLASVSYTVAGLHPGILDGIDLLQPEHLAGSPFQQEYADTAPNQDDWPTLIEKAKELDRNITDWTADEVRAIEAPTLLVVGDSDIIRPEHSVEIFRLLGGGVVGDMVGLPRAGLAVLPGTTHVGITQRAAWLVPMVDEFLDRPL